MAQRLKRGRSFYIPEEFLLHPLLSPKSLRRLPISVSQRKGRRGCLSPSDYCKS